MDNSGEAEPGRPQYLAELRLHGRALAAASTGLGAGFLVNSYIANIFAPHLLAAFGWSRSDFAFMGALGLLSLFVVPIVGRLTDLVGVRPVALVGVIAFALAFAGYSLMSGSLIVFAVITVFQNLLGGATTSSTVYSRLIAERFTGARGLAFAIAATTPALVGIVGSPLLQNAIETYGWRTAYIIVAVYVLVVGGIAVALIPRRPPKPAEAQAAAPPRRRAAEDYPLILRSPIFWVIIGGMLLCCLVFPLQSSQMTVMLIENGASPKTAAWMISLFAGGVVLGRFICGVALDRYPTHRVAAIMMGLPGVGLLLIALGFNGPAVLGCTVVLLGLSLGAESDLAAYLVIRFFKVEVYGTILGLVVAAIAASSALGALLLGVTLRLVDSFSLYMFVTAGTSVTGGAMFLLLGRKSILRSAGPQLLASG